MLIWKTLLTVAIYGLFACTAVLGQGATFNTLAATHAIIGGVALFVGLLPYTGRFGRALEVALRVSAGYAALQAGWFWLDLPKNDIGDMMYVVNGALIVFLAVALTPVVRLVLSWMQKGEAQ